MPSISRAIGLLAIPSILPHVSGITANEHMYVFFFKITLLQLTELEVVELGHSPQFDEMVL